MFIVMLTFANKEYLFLLLLIIPYLFWYYLSKHKTAAIAFADLSPFRFIKKSFRQYFTELPLLLRLITYVCVVLVLARPQGSNMWKDQEVEGIDIMLALDASTSMLAEDLKPNRIEAARSVAQEFISGRENDNIGLTVFAADAFTQCPMTIDHKVLLSMLQNVNCNMALHGLINDGTAIGMGIMNAITRLQSSKAKSRIVILLTDGSNNTGDISPLTAAEVAKSYGIRVYTIGVGTNGKAPYPYPLPGGGVQYVMVPVDIDNETLSQISQATGGKSYRATSNKELQQIYQDIDKLERTKFSVRKYSKKYELYQWFAAIGLLTLLLDMLLRMTCLKRLP